MEKYFKHINYTAEDIAAGKYEAWDLIRPMWLVYDIYKDRARYEETSAQFTPAQRRAHAWVYYNNEVFNGGHQQFLINSTGLIWQEALDCMEMVGADKSANNLRKIVTAFGGSIPFDRKERMDAFEKIWDADCSFAKLISKYDDEYYGTDVADEILEMLTQYMRSHPQEFVLEGDFEFFDD